MKNLILETGPSPSKRAEQGRKQRQQLAYRFRNIAYDCVELFMRQWTAHRMKLSLKAQAVLGVASVPEAVRILRPQLRAMMKVLGVKRVRDLLALYARTGERSWNFDHRLPLRKVDGFNDADVRQGRHIHNIRPRLACRNKARKWETPAVHDELFPKEGAK